MNKLQELEKHIQEQRNFHKAIETGTFPGSSVEAVSGLKQYLKSVINQLEKLHKEEADKQSIPVNT